MYIFAIAVIFAGGCSNNTAVAPSGTPSASPSVLTREAEIEKMYQQAKGAQQANQFDQAAALYKKILEMSPNHHRARKRLGEIYYFTGEYEPAIREFKKVLEQKPPNSAAIKSNLVLCYLAVDRPESAIPLINSDIDDYSKWGTHYSFLSQADYSLYMLETKAEVKKSIINRIKKRLAHGIKETEKAYPKSMLRASLALFEGDREKIGDHLEDAYKEANDDMDAISILFLLGALEDECGNKKEAVNYFKEVQKSAKETDSLDASSLMDSIYAYWICSSLSHKQMQISELESIIGQLRGGIKEPETEVFANRLKKYIEACTNNNHTKALSELQNIENSIMDESIEGDYLYDGIYKPYILQFLYTEIIKQAKMANQTPLADKYEKQLKQIKAVRFPE